MKNQNTENPIGLIDSGRGGKSVLMAMRKLMPAETYVYLADGKNAPYGNKTPSDITRFTVENCERLMRYPCKALVIACNTATAVAVGTVRGKYPDIPVVGLEPAVRPAIRDFPGGSILVLATPVTLSGKRFATLISGFPPEKTAGVVALPVQKLVSYVEADMQNSDEIVSYLRTELRTYRDRRFSCCVLGCTHFPFAKNAIVKALGYRPVFYDGGEGAAKRLFSLLAEKGALQKANTSGVVLNINTRDNK